MFMKQSKPCTIALISATTSVLLVHFVKWLAHWCLGCTAATIQLRITEVATEGWYLTQKHDMN